MHALHEKKVLVLGSSGLLGHILTPYLREVGFSLITHGKSNCSATDVECDATDANQLHEVILGQSPDFIINLIALTNVEQCNAEINLAYRLNVKVVENIVSSIMHMPKGKGRLIQISTDHVYDKQDGASAECEAVLRNVYALSKYAGEMAARGCESVVLRTNFFGPGRVRSRKSFVDSIRDTLKVGNEFFAFDDCHFNALSSAKLAEEIARVMIYWSPGTYNLGASTGLSKYEFARKVALAFDLDEALVKPRAMASMPGLVARPSNMIMEIASYETSFNTKLPSIESLIEEIGDNQNDQK